MAPQTATFVRQHLYDESTKRLLRAVYNDKNGGLAQLDQPIFGFLDDYAFLIRGLLDVYEAGFESDWLEWALELQEQQIQLFWDQSSAGFFTSPEGDPSIVIRLKEDQVGSRDQWIFPSCFMRPIKVSNSESWTHCIFALPSHSKQLANLTS